MTQNNAAPAVKNQEAVFSIFMGLAAVVSAYDSRLQHGHLLWAFAAFLAFNLMGHLGFRNAPETRQARALALGNTGLIAWVLWVSGGAQSFFWPMFLLPVFTACVHLGRVETRVWVALSAAALAGLYVLAPAPGGWERWVECAVKCATLALAAGVAGRAAWKGRLLQRRIELHRRRLERLADRVVDAAEFYQGIRGPLHDLSNPLTVVLGSVELALQSVSIENEVHEDLVRIRTAALRCRDVVTRLRAARELGPLRNEPAAREIVVVAEDA